MEDLLFMKQDKDVLTTIVNELGYDDRQFFLSFSSEDEQHRRFRLMTERVDGDIPLEEILQGNLEKLKKRYPEGFDAQKSMARLSGDL